MGDGDRWRTASDDADDRASPDDDAQIPDVELDSAASQADSGGLGRRELLAAGGLAAAGAGGWYVFLREDDRTGPVAVTEQNWRHWKNGNADAYRQMFHSESPRRESDAWNDDTYWEESFGPADGVTLTHVSGELLEETGDRAVVEEVYRRDAPDAEPVEVTTEIELRTENGAWKIWRIEFISSDTVDESN